MDHIVIVFPPSLYRQLLDHGQAQGQHDPTYTVNHHQGVGNPTLLCVVPYIKESHLFNVTVPGNDF